MKSLIGTRYETGELIVKSDKGRASLLRKCAHCGNDFFADLGNVRKGMGVTCSVICAKRHRGDEPKEKCICHNCGKEFEEFSSRIKDGRGVYCSKRCSNHGREKDKFPRICDYCGKTAMVSPYKMKKDSFYCSKECSTEARKTGEMVKCANPNCDKEFYLPAWQKASGRRFCSRECAGDVICGENHHLYNPDKTHRDGQEFTNKQRVQILSKYGWRCPVTGKHASEFLLHIHHIVPICEGGTNDPSNGIPLDPDVHMAVHHDNFDIYRYVRK